MKLLNFIAYNKKVDVVYQTIRSDFIKFINSMPHT